MAARSRSDGPLRVGVLGCGNVALNDHVPGHLALPDLFRLVAVADPTPERRELGRLRAGLGERDAHASADELLARDDLDVVDVCTPQHLRREIVLAAIASGRHVLSEKPLATVPRDAAAMAAAAREAGVTLGVVHNYLFFQEVEAALRIIGSGELGPVEVAILNYLGVLDLPGAAAYRPTWRHDATQAGGGVLTDMLHIVYLAEALLGRPIERVSAWVDARIDGASVEDLAIVRFEAERAVALVNMGWGVGPGGIEVSGPRGRLAIRYRDGATGPFVPFESLVVHGPGGRREVPVATDWSAAFVALLADFGRAVLDGRDPIAPGEQGLHILEATLAAYASAALGRTVTLPLEPGDPVHERGVGGLRELALPDWSPVRRHRLFGVGG